MTLLYRRTMLEDFLCSAKEHRGCSGWLVMTTLSPGLSPHITCSAHLVIRSKINFNNFVLDTNMRQYYLQTYLQINSYNTFITETNMDKIVTFQIDYEVPLKMPSNLSQTHFLRFHLILVVILFDSPLHRDLMHNILIRLRISRFSAFGPLF